jgi:hypothetical protein
MKRKQSPSWSELGVALTGVAALLTALVGAAWFFAGTGSTEHTPMAIRDVQAGQDLSAQGQAPVDGSRLAYVPAPCKRVESIAALGWIEDSKTHFCQKAGWAGVTNFPGGTYRSAGGGFCWDFAEKVEGAEKACLAHVLQRLIG